MAKKNDRVVYKADDGHWKNKLVGADRASSSHDTQKEANTAARQMSKKSGGGEVTTMGRDGRIVSKDTIRPAKDPLPPKDMEH